MLKTYNVKVCIFFLIFCLCIIRFSQEEKGREFGTTEANQNSQHEVTAALEMGVDMEETKTVGFMHGEMEDSGGIHNSDQL